MEPASLTKIMTCLLAMEHSDPQEPVTATAESLNLPLDASVLGLYEGETMTMEQMLYAMMLPSANDAANAVGVHIAGSLSAFAQMMNEKAQELGLQDSTFYNSNGLPEEGHLSSAYDLAQITRAAMAYPEFLDYAGAEGYSIPEGEQNAAHAFLHTDRFLRQDTVYYDETAIAGKTGWTSTAGNCLMTVMQRDGRTLNRGGAAVRFGRGGARGLCGQPDAVRLWVRSVCPDRVDAACPERAVQRPVGQHGDAAERRGELPVPASGRGTEQRRLPAVSAGGERGQQQRRFGCGWRTVPFGRGCWERFH